MGDDIAFTITAHYLNLSPALLFTAEGSNAFRLKLLLPDGFVQTGGNYSDYIGAELSSAKTTVTYTLKGYFTKVGSKSEFRLLRGSGNADETSLFIEKARLFISVDDHADQSKSGRLASNCDFTEGQFLLNWYGEQIYAHYYNGILFASYQDPSQGFKPQSWLQATGFDASKVGCFAVNDPHTSTTNPPTTNCGFTEGQFLLSWYGEQIYAHYYNGVLFASYQNPSQGFKPQSWLQSTGFDASKLSCFATSDPHTSSTPPTTPTTNPPVIPPSGTCSVSSPNAAFDFADCNGIGGWALDQANMNQPVLIDIYVDGVKTYAGITANGDRQDLVGAFGNSAARYHGFSYSFPANAPWKNSQNHSISVRICGVNNEIGGSPKTVSGCTGGTNNPTTPTTNPPVVPSGGTCSVSSPRGSVDIANERGIHGWALDESNMSKTVIIDIYINGTKVASVPADEDRSDLVSAFGNNLAARYHGFNIDLANVRYDPKNYNLAVQICGAPNPLWSGQVSFSARRSGDPEEPVDCGDLPEIVVKAKKTKWGYPICNPRGQSGGTGGSPDNTPTTSPGPDIPPATNPETPAGNNPGNGSGGTPNTNPTTDITSSNQPVPTVAILDVVDCEKISGWAYAKNGGYANLDIYISDIYGRFSKAATIRANTVSRPDVRQAYNNNPNIPLDCGFIWGIPDGYKHGHSLTIKVVPANDISPTGNITQSPMATPSDCNNPNIVPPGDPSNRPPTWKDFPDLKNLSDQYFLSNYVLAGPTRPINISQKLNCFGTVPDDSKYKYSITLYVDQPVNGTREIANFNPSEPYRRPGHTYLGFERYDSSTGQVIRLVVGYYVQTEWIAATGISTESVWGDDGGTRYDVALKADLSAYDFKNVIYYVKNLGNPKYNLVDNNCTTFACNIISPYISLPNGKGYIGPLGQGYNPADLGQDLRENKAAYGTKITVADNSTSPISTNCN
ncbi:hypothetical protein SD10_02675 [Spirosoma radiotolerans]|uniref:Uncharacterized protein n=1 Tax=Spirosoma radiotolerans TaxID=1379870 RepID=A0A0E3ZRU9_9BACT|nr:hypothetical protein SD10_02675 [Spirosoma radiotolerans]